MACRSAYKRNTLDIKTEPYQKKIKKPVVDEKVIRLYFGVDSKSEANNLLQNNVDQFEWVIRNKIYPNFYGRYLSGENCLTKEEIKFIRQKGCKIAAIYADNEEKKTEEQGKELAAKIEERAFILGIPEGTAIFLEIGDDEAVTRVFMKSFIESLMAKGYTAGFRANTDAKYCFDRIFSGGMQNHRETFEKCLVWATTPIVEEYNRMTTTHSIHPDNWRPYAPSGVARKEIAIWQYGKDCHPIEDDLGNNTSFNLNLVRNVEVIIDKMF